MPGTVPDRIYGDAGVHRAQGTGIVECARSTVATTDAIWSIAADQASLGYADRFILKGGHEYDGMRLQFQRALGTTQINM